MEGGDSLDRLTAANAITRRTESLIGDENIVRIEAKRRAGRNRVPFVESEGGGGGGGEGGGRYTYIHNRPG